MKTFLSAAVGFAGLLVAGTAYAGSGPGPACSGMNGTGSAQPAPAGTEVLFSSFQSNDCEVNSVALHHWVPGGQGGSSEQQQFIVPANTTISSLSFLLSDSTPSDPASFMVYLVPNGPGNLPQHSGNSPTGGTLLGTIPGTSLSSAPAVVTLSGLDAVTSGTEWISIVTSSTTTGAQWYRTGDQIGIDIGNTGGTTAGLYNAHVSPSTSTNPPPNTLFSVNTPGTFEMQIDGVVPEPASLTLLGAGLVGLGISRRRRAKRAAE